MNRNETIRMLTDEKEELCFQLEVTLTEAQENATIAQRQRDKKIDKCCP